jgi:antitoxin ParD1/3/4
MNISITPELEKFVEQEVKSGLCQSASEVVRAGLRRLKKDKEGKPRFMVSSQAELEVKLLERVGQLDRSGGVPADQVFAELKARRARPLDDSECKCSAPGK